MSICYNFDYLPETVLRLSGYDFIQFIKTTLGEPEANLLAKISVQTTSSFLLIEDPLDIFNYDIDDEELEKLKDQLSFKLKNKKVLIKPGVVSGFRSLREALKKKADQELARPKRKQRPQKQFSNVISSSAAPATAQTTTTTNKLPLAEHRAHVLKLINKWCSENKESFGLETFNLEENVDFILNIEFDENSEPKGNIKCKCTKLISLGKNDDKVQVSNYYKHLQSVGCDHMKHIREAAGRAKSAEQQSATSALLTSSSQLHSPLVQTLNVSSAFQEPVSHDNSLALSKQSAHGGKRRLMSQSQQVHSAKRSRL